MNRRKSGWIVFTSVAAAVILLIFGYILLGKHFKPQVSVPEGMSVSEEMQDLFVETEQGFYNSHLPLFASKIEILRAEEDAVFYRVRYFPFGSLERSYIREEGGWIFNIEKNLTRWE